MKYTSNHCCIYIRLFFCVYLNIILKKCYFTQMSLHNKFRLFLRDHIRPLYCIWYARNKKCWWKTRYILNIIGGIFFTWILCKLILLSFFFSEESENFITRWSIIFVGLGFVFTDAVKCIIYLMFVALLGKSGRSYLRALCFALIIAGPIHNLAVNMGEVVRVFSCSIVLTYNLTRTRYDLMTKPFQKTLAHMKDGIEEVKDTFQSLKNVTYVVHEEIMGDDLVNKEFIQEAEGTESIYNETNSSQIYVETIDNVIEVPMENQTIFSIETATITTELTKDDDDLKLNSTTITEASTPVLLLNNRIFNWILGKNVGRPKRELHDDELDIDPNLVQKKYENKMRKRCVQQLENGKERCRDAFRATFDNCTDALPPILNTLLCWPLKIDVICNINFLGDPDNLCDPTGAIPDNIGRTYVDLTNVEDSLYSDSSNVKVDYKVVGVDTSPDLQSAKETARDVLEHFNTRKKIFDAFLSIMERVLAFTIIWVLYSSYRYHKKYKNDLQYDNVYVTDYFKHIDERRRQSSKNIILPLKKYERRNIIVLGESIWQRTKRETHHILYYLFQFFMEMFTGLFFLLLDYTVSMILQIVRDHSEIQFVQDGEHTITFSIEGAGLIARLLRATLHNFNMHEIIHTELSNKQCLPNPSTLPQTFYIKLFLLYAVVLFLIYESSIFLRLRRVICSYFYRKQEKRRILYLYNSMRKQRRALTKKMTEQAKLNYVHRKIRRKINIFLRLRLECPRYFNWLEYFNMARRKCLVCDEYEGDNFVYCRTAQCYASYCHDCWTDMGDNCVICNGVISYNVIHNFYDLFEDFVFIRVS